jgi:hypothetical protein
MMISLDSADVVERDINDLSGIVSSSLSFGENVKLPVLK